MIAREISAQNFSDGSLAVCIVPVAKQVAGLGDCIKSGF